HCDRGHPLHPPGRSPPPRRRAAANHDIANRSCELEHSPTTCPKGQPRSTIWSMEGPARTAGSGRTSEDRFWEATVRSQVSRRAFLGGAAASGLAALLAACTGGRTGTTTRPTIAPHELSELLQQQLQAARSLPKDVQLRLQRGYMAERAGQ